MADRESINTEIERIFAEVRSGEHVKMFFKGIPSPPLRGQRDGLKKITLGRDEANFSRYAFPDLKVEKKKLAPDLTLHNSYIDKTSKCNGGRVDVYALKTQSGRTVYFEVQKHGRGDVHTERFLYKTEIDSFLQWYAISRVMDKTPFMAYHDSLVSLLNRQLVELELANLHTMEQNERILGQRYTPHTVALTTINGFKFTLYFWEVKP
ncbi:MAG TPA: hypothetical protein VN081_04705 [Dongiaceae bacterium]|nr:hypothetical protein [Dongiaceae bacterium]